MNPDIEKRVSEFQRLVQNPVIGSSSKGRTQELWDRLHEILIDAGREDFAREIYSLCSAVEDATSPEITFSALMAKLSAYGDVAIKVLTWRAISRHLLVMLELDFKQWAAHRAEECYKDALETAVKATYTVTDQNGKGKEYRFSPSSIQPSGARLEEALIRLYPEEYEERMIEIEYVKYLVEVSECLYYIVRDAHKGNVDFMNSMIANGA